MSQGDHHGRSHKASLRQKMRITKTTKHNPIPLTSTLELKTITFIIGITII